MGMAEEEETVVDTPATGPPGPSARAPSGPTPHDTLGSGPTFGSLGGFGRSSTASSGTGVSWTAAPDILIGEEASRSSALLRLTLIIGIAAIFAVWSPRGDYFGKWIATGVISATNIVTLWLVILYRDPKNYDPRKSLFHGLMCVMSIHAVILYVGVFSPAAMALCVGIYYFGSTDDKRAGRIVYAVCAGGYLLLGGLAATGVLRLPSSVLGIEPREPLALVATMSLAQILLGLTFWLARRSRKATLSAFERLERAARQIKKRDALLNEAQADLDEAMRGKLGRYTGQVVTEYQVEEVVGRGAMGEVYRAQRLDDGELAALKFLHPVVMENASHVKRFFREAMIAGGLKSPYIVRVLGTGYADDGAPFIAMELLEGQDLAWHLRQKKRLGMSATLELVSQVAQALAVADDAGIVHRDLKPQNLLRVSAGGVHTCKILDFGVSKVAQAGATLTQGAAVGTPSYMSPEQARGEDVDPRADVFALAVITYRCLVGRPAYTGPDMVSTMYNILHVEPVQPSKLSKISADVESVLALGLAKDKERRFSSASMFAAALKEAARGRLDQRLRAAADELIEQRPWGSDDDKRRGDATRA